MDRGRLMSGVGASTSAPCRPVPASRPFARRPRVSRLVAALTSEPASVLLPRRSRVALSSSLRPRPPKPIEEELLPLYVALPRDVVRSSEPELQALRSGLRALKAVGVNGVSVDVHWGLVEGKEPGSYDWTAYRQLLKVIRDVGLRIKVHLCFNSTDTVPLPEWIVAEGKNNPDIYFTDKAGGRNTECLTLGVDDVPVLRGRSAVTVYRSFMASFRQEICDPFVGTITECLIGLGPAAELKYPAHPLDKRWNFPGCGEFQCYDKFMLATLKACAEQVGQPSWGLGGPHDAGSYCLWPHQTGFFHHHGNWASPYGKFFLQWYSEMLARHADDVLTAAVEVFSGAKLRLAVRVPACHWWYNTASHAPELTAGWYNTVSRDGYLPTFKLLQRHGVALRLGMAEMRNSEQPPQAFCDPEKLLLQQRTVAAALSMPVVHESRFVRFDDPALARMETLLFETATNQGIDLPLPQGLNISMMDDAMFEPGNWRSFKAFALRVRARAEVVAARTGMGRGGSSGGSGPSGARASMDGQAEGEAHPPAGGLDRGRPVFA